MFWHAPYYRHPCFREGVIAQFAIAPGIAAWGLMTGVAMVKLGLGVSASLVMTLVVFAGSAQLAAIPPLLGGAPMWVVLVTALREPALCGFQRPLAALHDAFTALAPADHGLPQRGLAVCVVHPALS